MDLAECPENICVDALVPSNTCLHINGVFPLGAENQSSFQGSAQSLGTMYLPGKAGGLGPIRQGPELHLWLCIEPHPKHCHTIWVHYYYECPPLILLGSPIRKSSLSEFKVLQNLGERGAHLWNVKGIGSTRAFPIRSPIVAKTSGFTQQVSMCMKAGDGQEEETS